MSENMVKLSVLSPIDNGLAIEKFVVEVFMNSTSNAVLEFPISGLGNILSPLTYQIEIDSLSPATFYSFTVKVRDFLTSTGWSSPHN